MDAQAVADHPRGWARHQTVTDPAHVARAKALCADFAVARAARAQVRYQDDGHPLMLRALSDYDALVGVHFDPDVNININTGVDASTGVRR